VGLEVYGGRVVPSKGRARGLGRKKEQMSEKKTQKTRVRGRG